MNFPSCLQVGVFAAIMLSCINKVSSYNSFPPYFPKCNRLDPKFNDCLLKATETVRPFLKKGVPELKIPPLENFFIPEITVEQGTPALNFKARMTNIVVHGMENYKFSRYEFDTAKKMYTCVGVLNNMTMEGNVSVSGRLLVVPIDGSGSFTAGLDTVNINYVEKVKFEMKSDGNEYVQPEDIKLNIEASGPKVQLFGIFDKNGQLSEVANKVISDNINLFFDEVKPVIENVVTQLIKDVILKTIEDSIPYKNIYDAIPVSSM